MLFLVPTKVHTGSGVCVFVRLMRNGFGGMEEAEKLCGRMNSQCFRRRLDSMHYMHTARHSDLKEMLWLNVLLATGLRWLNFALLTKLDSIDQSICVEGEPSLETR
jgi:hypothetical protein